MCNRVFRCARSSAGEPQRTLHNSHTSVCGSIDLKKKGKKIEGEGEGTEGKEGMKKETRKRGRKRKREGRKRKREEEREKEREEGKKITTSSRGTGKEGAN